jgi:iron complex outermembrane recepter protein
MMVMASALAFIVAIKNTVSETQGRIIMKRSLNMLGTASLLAMGFAAQPAFAQEAAAEDRESTDIIVTARKREESVQDVPIAINVLTAEAIERKGIDGPGDVANLTPGLTFDVGLVPSDTRISIRGLQATRGRPNVAILVDGVDTSSENFGVAGGGILANLRLVDVERIEVVKGPQTVLYGRSAFAGAINYVSKRPGAEFEGSVSAQIARFDSYELKGAVGGPIGGGLSARANFGYFKSGGDYRNPVTGGKLNTSDVKGGAIALNYQSDGAFSAYARVQYSEEDYSERAQVLLRSVDPINGSVRTQDGGVLLQSLRPPATPRSPPAPRLYSLTGDVSKSDTFRRGAAAIDISGDPNNGGRAYDGTSVETLRGSLELNWDSDGGKLTLLSGYTDNSARFNQDFDNSSYRLEANTPNPAYEVGGQFSTLNVFRTQFGWPFRFLPSYGLSAEFDTRTDIKQFSQEVRYAYEDDNTQLLLDGLYWHEKSVYRDSSLFWLREGGNQLLAQFISASQGARPLPGPPGPPTFFHLLSPPVVSPNPQRITRETDSYSFAASLEQKLTSQLTAAVEGRIIYDEIKYTGFNFDPTPVNTYGVRNAANDPTQLTRNQVAFSKFNPRVSLSYNNDNGLLIFGNWARGTKPGGVDTTDQNGNVTDGEFKPESVDSFELGGKFTGDNGRLTINTSLFYSIYKDQQIGVIDSSGPVAISRTDNIGKSKSRGVEFEALWSPIDALFLRAAYTYTRARYVDYVPPRCSNVDSADTQSPICSFNGRTLPFTPKHQLNLSARYEANISGDTKAWIEADTRFVSRRFMSQSNLFWLPAYTQTDLRAGLRFGKFSVEGYVENLLKNKDPRTGSSTVDYGYFDLNSFNLPRGALVALAPRRSFGLKLGAKF